MYWLPGYPPARDCPNALIKMLINGLPGATETLNVLVGPLLLCFVIGSVMARQAERNLLQCLNLSHVSMDMR